MATESQVWEQIVFAKGTYNGMDLLLNHWRKAHVEHSSKGVKEEFDKTKVIGEFE